MVNNSGRSLIALAFLFALLLLIAGCGGGGGGGGGGSSTASGVSGTVETANGVVVPDCKIVDTASGNSVTAGSNGAFDLNLPSSEISGVITLKIYDSTGTLAGEVTLYLTNYSGNPLDAGVVYIGPPTPPTGS